MPKPPLDSLKAMSNSEKIKLCEELGLSIPKYEAGTKDHVIHMHLLYLLKHHFGYAGEKAKSTGRRPTKPSTVTILESREELKKLSAKIDYLTLLVQRLQIERNRK